MRWMDRNNLLWMPSRGKKVFEPCGLLLTWRPNSILTWVSWGGWRCPWWLRWPRRGQGKGCDAPPQKPSMKQYKSVKGAISRRWEAERFLQVLLSGQTTDRSSVWRERRREWETRVRQEDVMYLSPRLPAVWSDVHLLLILHQLGAKVTWRKEEDRKLLLILSIRLKRHLI